MYNCQVYPNSIALNILIQKNRKLVLERGPIFSFERLPMNSTLHFVPGQNFDCSLCGKCCAARDSAWQILVDPESRSKIRNTALELRVIQDTGRAAFRRRGGEVEIAQRADGRCVFLNPKRLCDVQGELGPQSKPKGCQMFPYQLTRTPDGVFVGLSYYCEAARRNEGRPLEAHGSSILGLLDQEPLVGDEALPVYRRVTMNWSTYRVLEDFLTSQLDVPTAMAAMVSLVAPAGIRRREVGAEDLRRALQGRYDLARQALRADPCLGPIVAHLEGAPRGLARALAAQEQVTFEAFNWTGQMAVAEAAGTLPAWAQEHLERYLRALLFRKFLVADRPLLSNLAILYLLPRLFSLCAGLSRLSRYGRELEGCDIDRAFNECEYHFVTHASALDRSYSLLVARLFPGPREDS